jgi:hypothetical protein
VGHEEDRLALVAEPVEHVEALLLEAHVAHREHLVDEQNVSVHLDHHREGQPHLHARRVVLQLQLLELAQLGELDHSVVSVARLARGEAEHHAVQQNVVASREVGVEAHAELDEGRHAAIHVDRSTVGAVDARQALEQGALARPVAADDAEEFTALYSERDVVQCVESLVARPPERVEDALLQR